jgi:phosphoglycolate phosphatase-like HAD superfamily hydrolase
MAALQKLELQPGLHDLMETLRSRRIRCAIATRNMAAAVDFFFTASGLSQELFAPVLTRNFPHNKPDARVAHAIAQHWGMRECDTVFVGDHVDDMSCGRDAGCVTVLVKCDENVELQQAECVPGGLVDHAITSLHELPALLCAPKHFPAAASSS